MNLSKSKRANMVADSALLVVMLFALAIICFIVIFVMYKFNSAIQGGDLVSTTAKTVMASMLNRVPTIFDGAILLILFCLWGTAVILSFTIRAHPVYLTFSLFGILAVLVVGGGLGNIYLRIINDPTFSAIANSLPITTWIFNHYILIIIIYIASIGIALYGKVGGGQ